MPHHFENLSMINAYTGRCRRLFTVYFVRKPVGKMDWFWFCWSAMTSHMDREYLAGKGCQFRPSVKGNNYHISSINFHWRNRKSKNQNLSLHQTWYLKFRYSVMNAPTCKFKKTSICNRFLYLKLHNVHRVRILYIHVYLAIDKNCHIYNSLCKTSTCSLESRQFEAAPMLSSNCLTEVAPIITDGTTSFWSSHLIATCGIVFP